MNKKERNDEFREPPQWLVNLVIRMRVARWRLAERLKRWAAGKKPWQLRLYFMFFIMAGGLTYCDILVMVVRPRREARARKQDSIYWHDMPIFERHLRWERLSDDPRFQRSETFYWRLVDSIMEDSTLRHSVDSLLKARPGLADTLHEIERMHPRVVK